jgi:hypothetical protein
MRFDTAPAMLLIGTIVDLYCNLRTRGGSLRAVGGPLPGRVIATPQRVDLADVAFRVNAGGQARARREGVRNVHAFARGTVVAPSDQAGEIRVVYNPYRNDTFIREDTGAPVHRAARLSLIGKECWCAEVA